MIESGLFAVLFAYVAYTALSRVYSAVRWQRMNIRDATVTRSTQPERFWKYAILLTIIGLSAVFAAAALSHAIFVEIAQ